MLITYLYLVYDQLLQLNTNCAWPFKQGKEFFLVDLGDKTNKYFFVQCDQINLVNNHFMIWVPLFLYLLFFLYLFRPLAWLFFWPCWCHRARGIFFFLIMFYNISAHKAVRVILRNYSIPIMWIVLYQISWSYRIVNKHRRTPWIKNDWIPT